MRERWSAVPGVMQYGAMLGAVLAGIALVLFPGSLARDGEAARLADRGRTTTATNVLVHVGHPPRGVTDLDGVEVTFTTATGEVVTTRLSGVVRYSADGPTGWRSPDASTGYQEPLRIRYDPADPRLAMAEDDYQDYVDYAFWLWDLMLLAAGLALASPAAVRFLRYQRA